MQAEQSWDLFEEATTFYHAIQTYLWVINQSAENASVAFVKGANHWLLKKKNNNIWRKAWMNKPKNEEAHGQTDFGMNTDRWRQKVVCSYGVYI